MNNGSFTHFFDISDVKVFKKANPDSLCIWRYQKGLNKKMCKIGGNGMKRCWIHNGKIYFTSDASYTVPFSNVFQIKVGAVPGQGDKYFGESGEEFVYSATRHTGMTRKMIYEPKEWIRSLPAGEPSGKARIYVNNKTLKNNPFFTHMCHRFDGSVLALFPKKKLTKDQLNTLIMMLNDVDWNDLGFIWHGKYVFAHGSLSKCLLPDIFAPYAI